MLWVCYHKHHAGKVFNRKGIMTFEWKGKTHKRHLSRCKKFNCKHLIKVD